MTFDKKVQVNQSYSCFHLHCDRRWLVSRGSPSHHQISGTSEGPGPVSTLRSVDALDANVLWHSRQILPLKQQWPPNVRHLNTSVSVQTRVGCFDQDCFFKFPSESILVFDYDTGTVSIYAMGEGSQGNVQTTEHSPEMSGCPQGQDSTR